MATEEAVVHGDCDAAFEGVRDAFAGNFADGLELGASLCVEVDGRRVVDLWGGWLDPERTRPWTRDSIACVFSCTKGLAAIVLLQLVERGAVDLDAPVARYWPEFAAAGKDELPVRYLLTHEAGLSAIARPMPMGSLSDWDAMVDALAAQEPWWEPGTAHGYHGVTFGHLVGEVARRADGRTIGTLLRDEVTGPLGVDCFLGLPAAEDARTATMVLAPIEGATFFSRWGPDSLGPKSFGNPPDCNDPAHTNTREFRAAEIPAANAHANARALARVYAALAQGELVSTDLVARGGARPRRRARPRHGAAHEVRPRLRDHPAGGRLLVRARRADVRPQRVGRIARRDRPRRGRLVRLRDESHDVDRASRRPALATDLRRALRGDLTCGSP